jgi:hypothetical protein
MLKKDKFLLGIILGIILPGIFFGLLYLITFLLKEGSYFDMVLSFNKILLISIFINLLPIRYYFVNLKFDRTGRGLIMITFILVLFYFLYFRLF